MGRSGGGAVNVVTKSGTNQAHGCAFYYLGDSSVNAQHPYADVKSQDRQHQFGATFGASRYGTASSTTRDGKRFRSGLVVLA